LPSNALAAAETDGAPDLAGLCSGTTQARQTSVRRPRRIERPYQAIKRHWAGGGEGSRAAEPRWVRA